MKRQTLTVDQYLELQESYTFKDLQFDSVNCYFNPDYYNNPMYFSPLSYEVIEKRFRILNPSINKLQRSLKIFFTSILIGIFSISLGTIFKMKSISACLASTPSGVL